MDRKLILALALASPLGCAADYNGIWGKCDTWDKERSGCQLTSEHTCASHLSPGPKNAPFEIVLSDLPPSTDNKSVHLQWFSPYEAPEFNPLAKPQDQYWRVYSSMRTAYPKFTDEDFNGGNVRVNETGHAVMRFRAPSTYYICGNRIRYPHIHVRLCLGEDYIVDRAETIEFSSKGPIVGACRDKKFKIASMRNVTALPQAIMLPPTTGAPAVTLAPSTLAVTTSTKFESTTDSPTTTKFLQLETETKSAGDIEIDESFDWDTLEFSPIYQCLMDKKVYDLLGSGCVDQCPANSEEKHGQCVREALGTEVEFDVSWNLQVHCDEACWNAKTPRTRHYLRLAAADHLDITFQEVLKVVLRPQTVASRRLEQKEMSGASLLISVKTNRVDATTGKDLLGKFVTDPAIASQILGLEVKSAQVVGAGEPAIDLQPGEEADEFAVLYGEVERDIPGAASSTGTLDGVPSAVIIAGGALVLILGGAISAGGWYKRNRAKNADNQAAIAAKIAEFNDASQTIHEVVGKVVDGDGVVTNAKPKSTMSISSGSTRASTYSTYSMKSTSTMDSAQDSEFGDVDDCCPRTSIYSVTSIVMDTE